LLSVIKFWNQKYVPFKKIDVTLIWP